MKYILIPLLVLGFSAGAQQKIQHSSTAANCNSNSTYIDAKGLNNNPQAVIIVEYEGKSAYSNPHPIGVWYNGSQWAIFNQDMAAMPAGLHFSITWKNPDANILYQKASPANTVNGKLVLNHPQLNNNPAARFSLSQVWNPEGQGGVYNNSYVAAEYDAASGKWMVKNQNGTAVAPGAAFNISVIPAVNNIDIAGKNRIDPKVVNNAGNNPATTINKQEVLTVISIDKANLSFESPLSNSWSVTGTAFANQPVRGTTLPSQRVLTHMNFAAGGIGGDYWKNLDYPIGVKGNAWIGTYENGNGDTPTGTLTSSPFTSNGRYLTFLMSGGRDIMKLYVELQVKKTDYETAWGASRRTLFGETTDGFVRVNRQTPAIHSEEFFRYYFDLGAELNNQYNSKTIRIVIVDDKSSAWGHINVDDIKFDTDLSAYISLMKNGNSLLADADAPVWGFFDSHAHPAAEEAFGKKLYIGSATEPMSSCFSTDKCVKNHSIGGRDPNLNDALTVNLSPHTMQGWPDLVFFPRFNEKIHQKYHVDFLKRAWQGGMRLMSALAVNNMFLATRALGHGTNGQAVDDESVMYRSLDAVKEMARQNKDWMEVATSAREARRIIKEGKLAIILGVEADVFGNFKSPDCTWGDGGNDKPLVTITEQNAESLLENKLNEYYNYGIRQVLPIHYLSKPFGGSAVFNGTTFLPHVAAYDHVRVKGGISRGVAFNLYEDYPFGASFTGLFMGFPAYAARIHKQDNEAEISMVNAEGLTPVGRTLFTKLMDKGFIVDQEHGSYESKDGIFAIAAAKNNYPVMASHVDPLGLAFKWKQSPIRWAGEYLPGSGIVNLNRHTDNIHHFGTSNIRNLSHEMELSDDDYRRIAQSNGTIGVFTTLNRKQTYRGARGSIEDNCAGSSRTFAQMYLYSLDKMNNRGVGLATDISMVDALCPRFGAYAAWSLKLEDDDRFKKEQRTTERYAQRKGVTYDVASKSYHPALFENSDIPGWEQDLFKALAAWDAGVNPFMNEGAIAISGEPGHADRTRSYARGLFAAGWNQLRTCCGDTPFEEAALYLLKNSTRPEDMYNTLPQGFWRDHVADVSRVYNQVKPSFETWVAKSYQNFKDRIQNNEPLRRYITGNRYWDFNLDGLAHAGLLPDLLQDLKNIGMTKEQLSPLFQSVEDYLQMWEKAEALRTR